MLYWKNCHWTVVVTADWLDHLTDQNRLIYSGIESCGDLSVFEIILVTIGQSY